MSHNPFLKSLGYSPDDRVVIFHADDVGMCQSSVSAFEVLVDFGLLVSGAVMVPCPWFSLAADYCRRHPEADMGVHLTLTSEWDFYRWGPISRADPASGLLDDEGFFHRTSEAVREKADPAAVQREIEAQIERALAAGIDLTHIDNHMGSIFHPRFMTGYVQAAMQHRLPCMILRLTEARVKRFDLSPEMVEAGRLQIAQLEEQGMPVIDHIFQMPLEKPENRLDHVKYVLDGLEPGLTHFIIHPAKATPETKAMTPGQWAGRYADYKAFHDDALRRYVDQSGLQVLTYRQVRDHMRESNT